MSARRLALAILTSCCATFAVVSPPALAMREHTFEKSFGEACAAAPCGPGQLTGPSGVAVSDATGEVYVVDTGNNRVQRFSTSGSYELEFNGAAAPGGTLSSPTGVAVDNSTSPLDPSAGDVYVIDTGHDAIDKFEANGTFLYQITQAASGSPLGGLAGVAVDTNGELWVYQANSEIDKLSDGLTNTFIESHQSPYQVTPGLAVDSEDNLYVIRAEPFVAKLNTSGESLIKAVAEDAAASSVAVDPSNNLLYIDNFGSVAVYGTTSSTSTLVEGFGSGHLTSGSGIAVDSVTHTVYVADSTTSTVDIFKTISVPGVSTGEASNLTKTGATLSGSVDPEAKLVTACRFEYATEAEYAPEASYGTSSECEPAPGSATGPVAVHADLSGLQPGTVYHYRIFAADAEGSGAGKDRTFIAPAQPTIDEESVSDIASTSATLAAQINPGGRVTTYRFEYGPTTAYGSTVPVPDGHLAGGLLDDAGVTEHLQDLLPSTTYHYRVVADNGLDPTVNGQDLSFTTQPTGREFTSLDDRQWELVSPPTKNGATLEAMGREGGTIQAAEDGSGLAYVASAPTDLGAGGNPAPALTQVLSVRHGGGGWSSQDLTTEHQASTGIQVGSTDEYRLFSSDLAHALLEPLGATPLSQATSERTPYLREDLTCDTSPATCYQPLATAANVPAGTKFGGPPGDATSDVGFMGATPDLSHIVVGSGPALTSVSVEGGLYEWTAGHFTLISILPEEEGGGPIAGTLGLGNAYDVRHAISDDGSRVIWHSNESGAPLYMSDLTKEPREQTVRLDKAENGAPGGQGEPRYQTASSDGSRIFFTDAAQLTVDSTAESNQGQGKPDLYEYDVTTEKLTDITVDPTAGEHADVLGVVLGASEEGSYVYFMANGALAQGAAEGECCNLYTRHDGATSFVATLSSADATSFIENGGSGDLGRVPARVSPNGQWLAFMSDRSLTGYNNRDIASGESDEEVFLYDASTGHLACASCNPTGARPVGEFDEGEYPGLLTDRILNWQGHWLAALIPGWTHVDVVHALYESRYLSDSGRLIFDSNDALAPEDTNGTWDVYEYEPGGVGDCAPSSVTFSESTSGCLGLISSGTSGEESTFLDASASGNDVFFLTNARLAPQDYDTALDVYDAHVCSAASLCLAEPASVPPPCSTGDACKAPPSAQPAIFGEPSSATFSGAGNLVSGPAGIVVPKSLTRAQRLARALKGCVTLRSKRKRLACKRQATRRYGKRVATKVLKAKKSLSASKRG